MRRRCENGNQGSILRREDDEFLRDVRNPPGAGLYAHCGESTFNKRVLHRDDGGARIYRVRYSRCTVRGTIHFAIRLYYIARFTPRIESHDPPPPLVPRVRLGSDMCKVYLCLPACLPGWLDIFVKGRRAREPRGLEGRDGGPDVVEPVP